MEGRLQRAHLALYLGDARLDLAAVEVAVALRERYANMFMLRFPDAGARFPGRHAQLAAIRLLV